MGSLIVAVGAYDTDVSIKLQQRLVVPSRCCSPHAPAGLLPGKNPCIHRPANTQGDHHGTWRWQRSPWLLITTSGYDSPPSPCESLAFCVSDRGPRWTCWEAQEHSWREH